jgi:integrase
MAMARWHIEERTHKDGKTKSYRLKVELPPDPLTGKRQVRAGTFRTKKEAEREAIAWVADVDSGMAVKPSRHTLADVAAQWLELRGPDLKPRTCEHYGVTLMTHVCPFIGPLPIQRVQPVTIDALYANLRERGHSEHAIHRCHQRLMQVFDCAVKRRIVGMNPMYAIDAPKMRPQAPTILTAPQIQRFLTYAAATAYDPLWLLLVQTGLRRGEALGVRWQDIDLDKGKLRVRQCVEALKGKPHIQTPKSPSALRTITLFPESVAALRAHRTKQLEWRLQATEWTDTDLVFCTDTGGMVDPSNVLRNLRLIIAKANREAGDDADMLPGFDVHDLRHTHATHLLIEGWPIPTVSRRLGHANPGITMRIYVHALSDVRDEEVMTPAAFAFAGTG